MLREFDPQPLMIALDVLAIELGFGEESDQLRKLVKERIQFLNLLKLLKNQHQMKALMAPYLNFSETLPPSAILSTQPDADLRQMSNRASFDFEDEAIRRFIGDGTRGFYQSKSPFPR